MSYLVLDIETVPLAAALAAPYPADERTPPANYKSEEAIGKWRERDLATWQEDRAKACSVNPRLGRVLCVGMADGEGVQVPYAPTEADEADVLRAFWTSVSLTGLRIPATLVTWNGSWDLRFLLVRSLLNRVDIPVDPHVLRDWQRPYNTINHTDVKRVLVGDGLTKGEGLDEWAAAFGLPGKTAGWTGASVWPAFQAGRHEDISRYCEADVEATRALYHRIRHLVED